MTENWKNVAGYEGLYQVSDLGRVKSLKYGKVRILKPQPDGDGYPYVTLCREGKRKLIHIHRLVAKAFIPNPLNLPVVNHKDENPKNNTVDNLEWCTVKYNNNYGTCKARRSKVVLQYDKSGNLVREWPSTKEVQRQTGFAQSNISNCCRGKYKSSHGYIWRFK